MKERNATTTQHTTVQRFAVYDIEDKQHHCVHFESTGDLKVAIAKSDLSDAKSYNTDEQQVLVRLNVDDEGFAIVYVDSAYRPVHDDALTIDSAIEMLEIARDQLRAMSGRPTP